MLGTDILIWIGAWICTLTAEYWTNIYVHQPSLGRGSTRWRIQLWLNALRDGNGNGNGYLDLVESSYLWFTLVWPDQLLSYHCRAWQYPPYRFIPKYPSVSYGPIPFYLGLTLLVPYLASPGFAWFWLVRRFQFCTDCLVSTPPPNKNIIS